MGTIKRLGAPSRNLKASIGDIYIDLKTGNKYQCTFSYVVGGNYECDWKLVEAKTKDKVEEKPVVEEVVALKTPFVNETVEAVETVVEEVKEEIPEQEQPVQPKRTDYAAYSKNKKKK